MYGNEVVGCEFFLYLVKVFCENYGCDVNFIKMVDIICIYLMLSMNLDGYEFVVEGQNRKDWIIG